MNAFQEYIEDCRDSKRKCTIRFRDVQGMDTTIEGHIIHTEMVSGREIIETDAGFVIGLDQVISINDRQQEGFC